MLQLPLHRHEKFQFMLQLKCELGATMCDGWALCSCYMSDEDVIIQDAVVHGLTHLILYLTVFVVLQWVVVISFSLCFRWVACDHVRHATSWRWWCGRRGRDDAVSARREPRWRGRSERLSVVVPLYDRVHHGRQLLRSRSSSGPFASVDRRTGPRPQPHQPADQRVLRPSGAATPVGGPQPPG